MSACYGGENGCDELSQVSAECGNGREKALGDGHDDVCDTCSTGWLAEDWSWGFAVNAAGLAFNEHQDTSGRLAPLIEIQKSTCAGRMETQ